MCRLPKAILIKIPLYHTGKRLPPRVAPVRASFPADTTPAAGLACFACFACVARQCGTGGKEPAGCSWCQMAFLVLCRGDTERAGGVGAVLRCELPLGERLPTGAMGSTYRKRCALLRGRYFLQGRARQVCCTYSP